MVYVKLDIYALLHFRSGHIDLSLSDCLHPYPVDLFLGKEYIFNVKVTHYGQQVKTVQEPLRSFKNVLVFIDCSKNSFVKTTWHDNPNGKISKKHFSLSSEYDIHHVRVVVIRDCVNTCCQNPL